MSYIWTLGINGLSVKQGHGFWPSILGILCPTISFSFETVWWRHCVWFVVCSPPRDQKSWLRLCCRKRTSSKYLNSNLSVSKMYDLYWGCCQDEGQNLVKILFYNSIFHSDYNYSFHKPKNNKCSLCSIRQIHLRKNLRWPNIKRTKHEWSKYDITRPLISYVQLKIQILFGQ